MRRECSFVVLFLLVLGVLSSSAFADILIDDSRHEIKLQGEFALYSDSSANLSFKDVLQLPASAFKTIPGFLNRGYTAEASWLRFTLKREHLSTNSWFLWVGPSMIDVVSIYVQTGPNPEEPSSFRLYDLGDTRPFEHRVIDHPQMVVPLELADGMSHQIFIRVKTKSTHLFEAWLLDSRGLAEKTSEYVFFQGGYLAIILCLGIINLLVAIRLWDKRALYYSLYLATLFGVQCGLEGFIYFLPFSVPAWSSDVLVGSGTGLGFSCFALFCMTLFKTRKRYPLCHIFLTCVMGLGFVATFLSTSSWYAQCARILTMCGLVLTVWIMGLAVSLARRGEPAGTLFLMSFSITALGALLHFFRLLGVVPASWLTVYAFHLGSVVHMIIMTLALSERFLLIKETILKNHREAEDNAKQQVKKMTSDLQLKSTQLEEALQIEQQVRENQSGFIDMISHEYRTPLAILKTNLDILDSRFQNKLHIEKKHLEKMTYAVQRLHEIFSHTFSTSFSEDKIVRFTSEQIPVGAFLCQLRQKVMKLWEHSRFVFSVEFSSDVCVMGDRNLLDTALFNLLDNAVKYGMGDDEIFIEATMADMQVQIDVINKIMPDKLLTTHGLLDRNTRGENSQGIHGTGIGLHLVQQIVARHHGAVTVEIIKPDQVRARVRLPMVQE